MDSKRLDFALDVKGDAIADDGVFEGYASVFSNIDHHKDIVEKGAFKRTITQKKQGNDSASIPMLWQHDTESPIGIFTNLKEDDTGLYVKGNINMDVQKGREALSLLKQGALNGISIGYRVVKASFNDKTNVRKLLDIELFESSLVTFPANPKATVTAIKAQHIHTKREFEEFLRDAGYSRSDAKSIASRGFTGEHDQRDAENEELATIIRKNIAILKG